MTVEQQIATEAPAAYLERYGLMLLIRLFETEMQRLFLKGEVHGTTHLYSGQEAGAVGVCSVLTETDRVAGTYRGHGHALALGVDPEALMAELFPAFNAEERFVVGALSARRIQELGSSLRRVLTHLEASSEDRQAMVLATTRRTASEKGPGAGGRARGSR